MKRAMFLVLTLLMASASFAARDRDCDDVVNSKSDSEGKMVAKKSSKSSSPKDEKSHK